MHPAGEYLTRRLIGRVIRDLNKGRGLGRLARRRRIAIARRNRKRRKIYRHADRRKYVCRPPGHLIKAAKHDCPFDSVLARNGIRNRQLLTSR
jgi:hypothetical protein